MSESFDDLVIRTIKTAREVDPAAWAGTKVNRAPLPSGPVEEFTQTSGDPRIVDFSGLSGPPLFGDTHPPVTELAAEVLRGSDPDSENIKGPTPYSDKSPISFYTHNQAEIDRLRAKLVRYQSRIERIRDLVKDLLAIIEVDQ